MLLFAKPGSLARGPVYVCIRCVPADIRGDAHKHLQTKLASQSLDSDLPSPPGVLSRSALGLSRAPVNQWSFPFLKVPADLSTRCQH